VDDRSRAGRQDGPQAHRTPPPTSSQTHTILCTDLLHHVEAVLHRVINHLMQRHDVFVLEPLHHTDLLQSLLRVRRIKKGLGW
jgi:hypothetical protein